MLFTKHSIIRAQQRGVRPELIHAVGKYADRKVWRGSGCVSIWISKAKLKRLGPNTPEGISTDRLKGLIVLLSHDQACVTVIRNQRAKTYRRNAWRKQ